MITQDDLAPVRIIMSEVEGWNGNDIHSGKDDAQIMSAWVGHNWVDMIWHCWNIQSTKRQSLVDSNANLAAQLKQSIDTIDDLKKQLAAGGGGFTESDRVQAVETNSIIKQIFTKITSIFK